MAGEKAATADKLKLETAEKMIAKGVDSETVRQETGWFKGYDGKWRFEIVDPIEMINTDKLYESRFTTLGELIEHPDLFAAYPDLADIQVTFEDISEGNGHYNRDFDTISLSDNYTKPFGAGGLLQTLTHEIQHAVQTREEFARGASPSKWAEKVNGGKLVEQASKKTRDIFEKAPDEFKQMVRKLNRAVLDYDDALVSQMSKEIADSQYADLYIEYEAARQAERNIREIVQRGDLSPIELYYRTAGEVEARDSANRLGLTTEERKQKRPDIDRSDVVFAEDGGVSYALSPNAEKDIQTALTDISYREDVRLTDTSPSIITSQNGVRNLPMLMKASHIRENVFTEQEAISKGLKVDEHTHYHGLGDELFLKIIAGLDDVTLAYRGTKNASDPSRRQDYFLLISQYKDPSFDAAVIRALENDGVDLGDVPIREDIINASGFGVTQDDINDYVDRAGSKTNSADHLKYAEPSKRLIQDVQDEIDISGYIHTLRDNDIRHIYNSHGEKTNEKYPITPADIKAIPNIVYNYDKVFVVKRAGKDAGSPERTGIIYVKVNKDNTVYYLEQATDQYHNENLLVNKQMIKG